MIKFDHYLPFTKETIDELMGDLKKDPSVMTSDLFTSIHEQVKSKKLQIHLFDYKDLFTAKNVDKNTLVLKLNKCIKQPQQSSMEPQPAAQPAALSVSLDAQQQSSFFPAISLGEQKYIYGTYFEMAFHNFYSIMAYIYAQVFQKEIMQVARMKFDNDELLQKATDPNHKDKIFEEDFANEKYVWNTMFSDFENALSEQKLKAVELWRRHFAFLFPQADVQQKKDSKNRTKITNIDDFAMSLAALKCLSKVFRVMRNEYAHYQIILNERQSKILTDNAGEMAALFNTIFVAAKRIVKTRFSFDDAAMQCTESQMVDRNNLDERHRPKVVDNPKFKYKAFKKGKDQQWQITVFGLVQMVALFLEKKYTKMLMDKVGCVGKDDAKVIFEILTVFRSRLNVNKITTDKESFALALDILTELRRCPQELFEMLPPAVAGKPASPDVQSFYRTKLADDNNGVESLMTRKQDRFPQLVMRYIDDEKLFSKLRFQVALGKYFYRFYNKHCIDHADEPRVRTICKDVHAFGRITELEELRNQKWCDIIRDFEEVHQNTVDEKPYLTDHYASYMLTGNRIGMRMNDAVPELTAEGLTNLPPTCWLSIYELPAMMLLMQLKGAPFVENLIVSTIDNYQCFFADVKDGKLIPQETEEDLSKLLQQNYPGLQLKSIPEKLQEYLLNKECNMDALFTEWAGGKLNAMIEDTERRLTRVEEDIKQVQTPAANKIGKKNYVRLKPGVLASFLAREFMLFKPKDEQNKGKLTSLNYRVMQSMLALYADGDFDRIKRMLVSAKLVNTEKPQDANPILSRLCNTIHQPENVIELYKSYLKEKKCYLNEIKKSGNLKTAFFLYADRLRWQEHSEVYYRELAGRYLKESYCGTEYEKTIDLPRGLFLPALRQTLKDWDSLRDIAMDENKNASYLIYAYFKNVLDDDCQDFYTAKRCYPIFNILYARSPREKIYKSSRDIYELLNREKSSSIHKAIQQHVASGTYHKGKGPIKEEERLAELQSLNRKLSDLKNTENDLKRYKIQDMILFLLAKTILQGAEKGNQVENRVYDNLKLKHLLQGDVLETKVPFKIKVGSGGNSKIIFTEAIKIKDYPSFFHFLTDTRMPTLLRDIDARIKEIEHSNINSELDNFDKVRSSITKRAFEYEAAYHEACRKTGEAPETQFGKIMQHYSNLSEDEQKETVRIRNMFAHNFYAKTAESHTHQLPQKAVKLSEKFESQLKKDENNVTEDL